MDNRLKIMVAIAGPSGSGKSMFAKSIQKRLSKKDALIICQDSYYKNWPRLKKEERKRVNFDDIKAFDLKLLAKHLKNLKNSKTIYMPLYDFIQSQRLKKTRRIQPKQIIIVEGLSPYFNRKLRELFDYKIYINTSNAICLARRLARDTQERGDNLESICKRYFRHVLPMQKKYVEPQKKWADLVITLDSLNSLERSLRIGQLIDHIKS